MVVTATADSLPPRRLRPQEVKAPEVVLDRRHLDLPEAGVARIGLYRHEVVPVRERGIRCVPTLVPGPGLAPGSSQADPVLDAAPCEIAAGRLDRRSVEVDAVDAHLRIPRAPPPRNSRSPRSVYTLEGSVLCGRPVLPRGG